jgi:hypothetical protein
MRTEWRPRGRRRSYTEDEMRWAIALCRNAAEQLDAQGYSGTITPTDLVLADMLEQLLGRSRIMTNGPVFRGPDGRPLPTEEVAKLLRALVGERLDGGCDDCTAWHELVEEEVDLLDIWIHHDPTCPQLRPEAGDEEEAR